MEKCGEKQHVKIRKNKLENHKIFCSQNQPNIFKEVYSWLVPFILMNMWQICFYPLFRFSDNQDWQGIGKAMPLLLGLPPVWHFVPWNTVIEIPAFHCHCCNASHCNHGLKCFSSSLGAITSSWRLKLTRSLSVKEKVPDLALSNKRTFLIRNLKKIMMWCFRTCKRYQTMPVLGPCIAQALRFRKQHAPALSFVLWSLLLSLL